MVKARRYSEIKQREARSRSVVLMAQGHSFGGQASAAGSSLAGSGQSGGSPTGVRSPRRWLNGPDLWARVLRSVNFPQYFISGTRPAGFMSSSEAKLSIIGLNVTLVRSPAWQKQLPFTSEDIDFCGNRDDVQHIPRQLKLVPAFPHKIASMTALAGAATVAHRQLLVLYLKPEGFAMSDQEYSESSKASFPPYRVLPSPPHVSACWHRARAYYNHRMALFMRSFPMVAVCQ